MAFVIRYYESRAPQNPSADYRSRVNLFILAWLDTTSSDFLHKIESKDSLRLLPGSFDADMWS